MALPNVTQKPWNHVGLPDGIDPKPAFNVPNEKVGLVFFVAVACVLFSLLVVSYFMRMRLGMGDWVAVQVPSLLWWNTAALILSSVAFQLAVFQARKVEQAAFTSTTGLLSLAGGLLAIVFIVGQYTVWQQLSAAGLGMRNNPANAFFYLLTGVHVIHLLGGIWVWARCQLRLLGDTPIASTQLSLELCAWYWHFLLLVWAGLFYLLATT